MTPQDCTITANRLAHHMLDWGGEGPQVLLRGYYHFPDYVADLSSIVRHLGGRVALVGHSMGGSAAIQYAGTEPERVTALVCIDALGPPDSDPSVAPERYAGWLADLERSETRERPHVTLTEATARLRERFPRFTHEIATHMALHGTRVQEDARQWTFDPLHQTRAPQPYYTAQGQAFWARVSCPVLYVVGAESHLRLDPAEEQERLRRLRAARVDIPHAGHHPHLEKPEQLAQVLIEFLMNSSLLK